MHGKPLRVRLAMLLGAPLIVVALAAVALTFAEIAPANMNALTFGYLFAAGGYTLVRLLLAYVLAVAVGIPLAILATRNTTLESLLLPLFDVLDSVPILAFFPVVILVFIKLGFLEGAAIFILFLNILWNIVFTLVGGLKLIPRDITYAARIFGLRGFSYFRHMLLPSIFPQLVTGSILALAEGWNLVIVAEALHAYVPGGETAQDLVGIGSILVHASAAADNATFILALIVMVLFIALFNLIVWQRLLHISQRYRFE